MRRLHRWFGLITGLVMMVVASTGIAVQTIDLISPEHHHGPPPGAAEGRQPSSAPGRQPAASPGPSPGPSQGPSPDPDDGPPQSGGIQWRGLLDHIHDGEVAGTAGRVVSLVMGVALLVFSISGIWIYLQMFAARRRAGRPEMFW